ncbi:MAG: methylmalonyl Co-A mutase-associated GTPase MeaB [Bacteroidetes bacterium]|nr:methylmalonyl Co-A mutase-associated GTPase MeaB [Bacteroidota bacterium]
MDPAAASSLATAIRSGDRRALARGLSIVESSTAADRTLAHALLAELQSPTPTTTRRIGITGSPGVGKSTFIETFGLQQIAAGHRVAVLAVDPTSKRSGGSILGDKVRMQHLSVHDNAFVRPSPSRLALGGATATTRESILLCEAAGYDTIIVETVGVGQSEIDVADMVDMFLLLVLPTAGDDVQAIKRGVMEVADAVIVTKADIDTEATSRATAQYTSALRLMLPSQAQWRTTVCAVSAVQDRGMDDVAEIVDRFFHPSRSTTCEQRRTAQRVTWFDHALRDRLVDLVIADPSSRERIANARARVEHEQVIPSVAIDAIFSTVLFTINHT